MKKDVKPSLAGCASFAEEHNARTDMGLGTKKLYHPMTTPTETPTPRTDAVAFDVNISTALDCSLYAECVRADEMRTLERQLTAATAQLKQQQDRINELEAMLVTYGHR